jgi:hypothetical protein
MRCVEIASGYTWGPNILGKQGKKIMAKLRSSDRKSLNGSTISIAVFSEE